MKKLFFLTLLSIGLLTVPLGAEEGAVKGNSWKAPAAHNQDAPAHNHLGGRKSQNLSEPVKSPRLNLQMLSGLRMLIVFITSQNPSL